MSGFFTRREFLRSTFAWTTALTAGGLWPRLRWPWISAAQAETGPPPMRPLGRTGVNVTIVGLGGEGVMRSTGRMRESVPVIRRALDLGINYFDTAPAYQQSQDYLGEGLGGDRGDRTRIFLASKTHDRSRDGSLRLLENSLQRLRTDHLDLWQLHDLRDREDLERIFGRGGAIEAVEAAKAHGLIRFVGITGHYDPAVLVEALERYPFDTVLASLNVADPHRLPFRSTVLPAAQQRGAGVIAMKVLAQGSLTHVTPTVSVAQAIQYVLSLPISTAIIGCDRPAQVEENVRIGAAFAKLVESDMEQLEETVRPVARQLSGFKKWW